ncbi:hypothetical protein BpHYR1_017075 [Brachionus plicatilis]|uniref:Uncharacterized protein n=1 Tax=Brachionus plicatilis TaxID=10195 RepID=A0A3M7RQQ4_BRAPC|nr:hypothetical protein BpHYR1_017075 [Brachionus plicatilis]
MPKFQKLSNVEITLKKSDLISQAFSYLKFNSLKFEKKLVYLYFTDNCRNHQAQIHYEEIRKSTNYCNECLLLYTFIK